MYSDTLFSGIRMDMLALESAITNYELNNELTESYLNSDVSYDEIEAANEAASYQDNDTSDDNDFAFGFGLFEDKVALESEGADSSGSEKKPSFGSRISGAIKSVLGAIKKFFSNIAEKIKALGAKIAQKRAEAKAKKNPVPPSLKDQVLAAAREVRSNYQKAISMLDEGVRSDAVIVKNICVKINKAMADAGIKKGVKAKGDNVKNLEKINEKFTDNDGTDREIEDAENSLERCAEIRNNLAKAYDIINNSYSAFLNKITAMKNDYIDNRTTTSENLDTQRTGKESKDIKQRDKDDIAEAKQMQKDWNADHKSKETKRAAIDKDTYKNEYNKNGELTKRGGTVGVTEAIAKSIIMYEEYSGSTSITNLIKVCDSFQSVCKDNYNFCESIGSKADSTYDDNPNAKKAYRLCKIYFKASNTFTDIAHLAANLSNGTCFGKGNTGNIKISDPTKASKK